MRRHGFATAAGWKEDSDDDIDMIQQLSLRDSTALRMGETARSRFLRRTTTEKEANAH